MKIKGVFPVRWAAQDGNDGRGVTIVIHEVKYAVTATNNRPSSGWSATFPSTIANGNYLWTWTHIEYSDGTKTDAYSVARQGIDGKGIRSSVVTYSLQASSVNPDSITNWGNFPSVLTDGYWLYTRTVITYSEGDTTTSYSVAQVGVGSYYAGVQEYYKAGADATNVPEGAITAGTYTSQNLPNTSWSQQRPALNTSTPYLWNFEISADSRGNLYVTDARCIGNFAKGITSIVETYAISAYGTPQSERDYPSDIAENDWKDEHQAAAPTDAKPYQWNKTQTTYNNGDIDIFYHLSAIKGLDGKGTVYIDLDNENDSLLYDGSGNRVGGAITSNIRLYENGVDITSGKTFTISDKSQTVQASVSGSVLTVSGITSNDGYVIVRCNYNSVYYYARFTVKRLSGTDKYEVVCTPSSITYNDTTKEGNSAVTVECYKTAQNGVRSHLLTLPSGFKLLRFWSEGSTSTDMASTYTNGRCTFTPVAQSWSRYRVELQDANGNLLDYETIPIGHVEDGAKGDSAFIIDAENENIGFIVEDTGAISTAQSRSIRINAFYGSEQASGVTFSVSVEGNADVSNNSLLAITQANGVITLSTNSSAVWRKESLVKITVTASHASYGSRSIVINCVPVFGGAKADYYELLPSLSAITFTKANDGKSLTPSSRTLTVQCLHITSTGQTPVSIPSGYSVRYSYSSQPTTSSSGNSFPSSGLSVSSSTTYTILYLSLFKGSTLIDKETVPIIKGGIDGADNIGVSINLDNDMSSFPMTYAGRPSAQSEHESHVALYVGNILQTLTYLAIELSDSRCSVISTSKDSHGNYTGDFKIRIPTLTSSPYSFTSDKVTATITVKSADVPQGKTIVFTMQGVRAGAEGKEAELYELMPSVRTISFARNASNVLTPSSISFNCGYQKNKGGEVTNYAGNNISNLWKDGGAKYNMMYRYQKTDGTFTGWSWNKDLPSGTLNIPSSTSYIAVEFILTDASGVSSVAESNIIDREAIPIVKGGEKGGTGDASTSYWLTPSVSEIQRYQTAQLSDASVTCSKMRKVGSNAAETAPDMTIYYRYTELGIESAENVYSSAVNVGLWWSKIRFIGKVGGAEVAIATVVIKDTPLSCGDNLINGTNFIDAFDSGTSRAEGSSIQSGGVDGTKYLYEVGFRYTVNNFKELFKSIVHQSSEQRLQPSTWYTLSFWAKGGLSQQISKNETRAAYGFADEVAYFMKGARKIIINGSISQAAANAGKELRVFVYQKDSSGWTWSASAATSSTSATSFTLSFNAPNNGLYYIAAYVYRSGETTITDSSLTATVNYYQIYSSFIRTHVYPSAIDTSYAAIADGARTVYAADGENDVELTSSWALHTFTFRTKSSIPSTDIERVLFRHFSGTASVSICRIKLERGIFATEWCRSEYDKTGTQGIDGCIMRTTQWAAGQEYHNDSALTSGTRFLDIIVTGVGTSNIERYMCRVTHVSTSSGATGMPTATNTYWTKLDNSFPIYTPLIMADNALLRFTQTNQLVVADANGNIIGRMGGGEYLLALGSGTPANAPFRVKQDGKLFASNADIEGKIQAQSGIIGGFSITETSIMSNINNYLKLDSQTGEVSMAGGAFSVSSNKDVTIKGQLQALRGLAIGIDIMSGGYYYGGVLSSWNTFVIVNWTITSGIEGSLMLPASHLIINSRLIFILNNAADRKAFQITPQSNQNLVWKGTTYSLTDNCPKLNLHEAAMFIFNESNNTWYMTKIS